MLQHSVRIGEGIWLMLSGVEIALNIINMRTGTEVEHGKCGNAHTCVRISDPMAIVVTGN